MTDVEVVALWVGLISSIVGVVLSVVAIAFAVLVNNRSSDINDKMIRSLQKVEFTVERSSDDTRELIKAAWDKMLGNVERASDPSPSSLLVREITSGLSAELRTELGLYRPSRDQILPVETEQIKRLDDLLESVETSLALQMDILGHSENRGEAFDYILEELAELSPEAQELASMIARRHLTSAQYQSLIRGSQISEAIRELRESGFLVPLEGYSEDGDEVLAVVCC